MRLFHGFVENPVVLSLSNDICTITPPRVVSLAYFVAEKFKNMILLSNAPSGLGITHRSKGAWTTLPRLRHV